MSTERTETSRDVTTDTFARLFRQERFILDVTEALAKMLAVNQTSRSELAKLLGKSKGFVSQVLAGNRNLTLRTVADIAGALGYEARLQLVRPQDTQVEQCRILPFKWEIRRSREFDVRVAASGEDQNTASLA